MPTRLSRFPTAVSPPWTARDRRRTLPQLVLVLVSHLVLVLVLVAVAARFLWMVPSSRRCCSPCTPSTRRLSRAPIPPQHRMPAAMFYAVCELPPATVAVAAAAATVAAGCPYDARPLVSRWHCRGVVGRAELLSAVFLFGALRAYIAGHTLLAAVCGQLVRDPPLLGVHVPQKTANFGNQCQNSRSVVSSVICILITIDRRAWE